MSRGVGAAVEEDPRLPGQDRARPRSMPVSTSTTIAWRHLVGGDELLVPAEDQPDRPPGGPGERGDVRLEVEVALAAEAAAEVA